MADLFDTLELEQKVTCRLPEGERYPLFSGIPVGHDQTERKRREWDGQMPKFPFEHMRVGECFAVRPLPGLTLIETQNRVSGAACSYRGKQPHGSCNFTTRQVNGRFVRCWRVE